MKVSTNMLRLMADRSLATHTLKTFTGLLLFTSISLALSGHSRAQIPTLPSKTSPSATTNLAALPETAYTLGAGDQLRVDVFDVPEYSGEYQVLADGTINLPIIGTLNLRGTTLNQATQIISQAYAPFIRRPLVTVSLLNPRPLQIAVAGAVNRPGSYILPINQGKFPTLTDALELAGGLTGSSNIRSVQVRRGGQSYNLDLEALLINANLGQNPTLRDGDSIVIPTVTSIDAQTSRLVTTSGLAPEIINPTKVAVVGEVPRPGSYILESRGTGEPITLTQALEEAGGVLPFADIRQVLVTRRSRFGTSQMTIDLWAFLQNGDLDQDLVLQDGDTISIPVSTDPDIAQARLVAGASFGTQEVQPFNVALVGQVNRPGTHTVTPGGVTDPGTLTKAIQEAGGIRPDANIREVEVRRLNKNGEVQVFKVDLWKLLRDGDLQQDVLLQEGDEIVIAKAEQLDPAQLAALQTATFAPESIRVNVVGEVIRPGGLELRPGTPLNEALFAAGGLNQVRAKKTAIDLMRINPDGTISSRRVQLDFVAPVNEETNPLLQNGDVVVVPRNGFAGFRDTLSTVLQPLQSLTELFNPIDRFLRIVE